MTNFGRIANVTVGPPGGQGLSISGHRITFSVTKTDDAEANTMDVQIYNAAPDTRKVLETTDNRVILTAGYMGGEIRQIAVGDITRGSTKLATPDRITTATCGDGLLTLATSRASLSYDGAVSARQIIEDIADRFGLELRDTAADLSGKFQSGWAFVGPARDAMSAVTRRFGLSWSIQNEEIQVTERRGVNTTDAILITPQTGLIGSPEPMDDNRDDLKEDKEAPGIMVTTLLNPLYEPGGLVVIDSQDYSEAEFRIRKVDHNGDTRGDAWESRIEVVER
ncbi:MAG: hypothetical protein Unbinned3138contig1000_32 [Prokaryotic dsDNA virus sp.]|nr:MAG: hypothetical protein Unbinned3138contig1000_32 [Prokaryotic dsDNA virus sp.]